MLGAIVVVAENGAIGKNGDLLCHLPADLKHFKTITMGYPIIMGRKTFESLKVSPCATRCRKLLMQRPMPSEDLS